MSKWIVAVFVKLLLWLHHSYLSTYGVFVGIHLNSNICDVDARQCSVCLWTRICCPNVLNFSLLSSYIYLMPIKVSIKYIQDDKKFKEEKKLKKKIQTQCILGITSFAWLSSCIVHKL